MPEMLRVRRPLYPIFVTVVAAGALALTGCGDGAQQVPATGEETGETAASWSDPDAPEGISVGDGRLFLPAVAGNPGAVYFTIRNAGDAPLSIASAAITGAGKAMLHETVSEDGRARMRNVDTIDVPAGGEVRMAPGGLHVMAMDLSEALEEGAETEVTLTFSSGDKVSFPSTIMASGGAD